jgi:hypothetical protein
MLVFIATAPALSNATLDCPELPACKVVPGLLLLVAARMALYNISYTSSAGLACVRRRCLCVHNAQTTGHMTPMAVCQATTNLSVQICTCATMQYTLHWQVIAYREGRKRLKG